MLPAAVDPFLIAVTRTIVDRFAPERVVLFGSRARGDHQPESDYDLIVVLDTPLDRGERDRPIREALPVDGPRIDVIVYTPTEFDRRRLDVGAIAYAGETEGQVLYDRTPSRWPRQVREDRNTNTDSLSDWLARAEGDMAMTTIAVGAHLTDGASFHAHEAAEKFLKAALITNHQRPPRTHDLRELLSRSVARLREDPDVTRACEVLAGLWPNMRYPEKRLPTVEESEAAMTAARDVRAAVLRYMKPGAEAAGV